MAGILFSALSIDAFMAPMSAVTSSRTTAPAMNEAAAKAAWFRKNELSLTSRGPARAPASYKAAIVPNSPMPYGVVNNPANKHGLEGAVHSTADILQKVRARAEKAKKAEYGGLVEMCSERKSSGWTTN